jgi:chemotaxis signal transduction protein
MTSTLPNGWSERASALRQAFDHGFVEPPSVGGSGDREDFLAIRVGRTALAIRLSEIGGLYAGKRIRTLPGGGTMLGLAGFRGAVLPVYDLGLLLGSPADAVPRWLITAAKDPVAFAFTHFDGHFRLSHEDILPHQADAPKQSFIHEIARGSGIARPIVTISSVVAVIATPRAS